MKNYILLTVVFFITAFSFGQDKKHQLMVKETIEKYKTGKSISYDIHYKMKFFDDEKPYILDTHVDLIKNSNDTAFGGNFLYSRRDSFTVKNTATEKDTLINVDLQKYYDSKLIYVIDHTEKKNYKLRSFK